LDGWTGNVDDVKRMRSDSANIGGEKRLKARRCKFKIFKLEIKTFPRRIFCLSREFPTARSFFKEWKLTFVYKKSLSSPSINSVLGF